MWGAVTAAIAAILAWFAAQFVGLPMRRFFTLRGDVSAELENLARIKAPTNEENRDLPMVRRLTPEEQARLDEAAKMVRDLRTRMHAFKDGEGPTVWLLEKMGYDVADATRRLETLSEAIKMDGPGRRSVLMSLKRALKIKF